ncbi:manganese transporter [Leucobacter sp. Psy1]|uniref:metal ABC transporter substrate-binding protein n=1 Tax=Leucobacter sp. Psy1 TaxID=2875729 RepID=UPI001CD7BD70|nr:zinc ABC transporter substrate-binding protein [Leucobacter sp. Psy1]UBH06064.1 manganese transporter [Leucobacter sp. Psy1]
MTAIRSIRLGLAATAITAVVPLAAGCAASELSASGDTPIEVYATTGYLADAVTNIAPDARVTTMVGPGGDPHTYQPSTQDITAMQEADLVVWNGLHLEAQMIDQLESLGDRQLAAGEEVPRALLLSWPETDDAGNALFDPHVWNSPEAWKVVVTAVADKLAVIDPDGADTYAAHADGYLAEIDAAAAEAATLLSAVPEPRMLVTGHDAFNYFGEEYELEVHATDFVSTDAVMSAEEISELGALIARHRVPVIFQDNQANPQAITSLREAVQARGWEVAISEEELYADSLGSEPGVDTYLGAFSHNARAVAEALGASEVTS